MCSSTTTQNIALYGRSPRGGSLAARLGYARLGECECKCFVMLCNSSLCGCLRTELTRTQDHGAPIVAKTWAEQCSAAWSRPIRAGRRRVAGAGHDRQLQRLDADGSPLQTPGAPGWEQERRRIECVQLGPAAAVLRGVRRSSWTSKRAAADRSVNMMSLRATLLTSHLMPS